MTLRGREQAREASKRNHAATTVGMQHMTQALSRRCHHCRAIVQPRGGSTHVTRAGCVCLFGLRLPAVLCAHARMHEPWADLLFTLHRAITPARPGATVRLVCTFLSG